MTTWFYDADKNRCSLEYWGSEKAAREALATLTRCIGCTDCHACIDCSDCVRCTGCFGCSGCFLCKGCQDCSESTRSIYCNDSAGLNLCACCSGCKACLGCGGCTDCARCTGQHGEVDEDGKRQEAFIVPSIPNIHQAIYAAASKPNALDMADIHSCKTTHCRAGWVTTRAGKPGAQLEKLFNWEFAATLIYEESGYAINPCRFYDTNEVALADMKRLAEAGL